MFATTAQRVKLGKFILISGPTSCLLCCPLNSIKLKTRRHHKQIGTGGLWWVGLGLPIIFPSVHLRNQLGQIDLIFVPLLQKCARGGDGELVDCGLFSTNQHEAMTGVVSGARCTEKQHFTFSVFFFREVFHLTFSNFIQLERRLYRVVFRRKKVNSCERFDKKWQEILKRKMISP